MEELYIFRRKSAYECCPSNRKHAILLFLLFSAPGQEHSDSHSDDLKHTLSIVDRGT